MGYSLTDAMRLTLMNSGQPFVGSALRTGVF